MHQCKYVALKKKKNDNNNFVNLHTNWGSRKIKHNFSQNQKVQLNLNNQNYSSVLNVLYSVQYSSSGLFVYFCSPLKAK